MCEGFHIDVQHMPLEIDKRAMLGIFGYITSMCKMWGILGYVTSDSKLAERIHFASSSSRVSQMHYFKKVDELGPAYNGGARAGDIIYEVW